ncbi:unnamed protein product [Moneuplotes crassus]|uniref:Uncharacterized protein n=1 Tax=Euplotes crassus TaxID=5936 RepID=A0AAD1XXU7_EUPCR|nr:unnamed protein product [Moneuplotes crassus]
MTLRCYKLCNKNLRMCLSACMLKLLNFESRNIKNKSIKLDG